MLWWARRLRRPLVVLEALRCGYPWASDRLHRFVLDGMADNGTQTDTSLWNGKLLYWFQGGAIPFQSLKPVTQ